MCEGLSIDDVGDVEGHRTFQEIRPGGAGFQKRRSRYREELGAGYRRTTLSTTGGPGFKTGDLVEEELRAGYRRTTLIVPYESHICGFFHPGWQF